MDEVTKREIERLLLEQVEIDKEVGSDCLYLIMSSRLLTLNKLLNPCTGGSDNIW